MWQKRCFWIFNRWEQVDENEGSFDGGRTCPLPSIFYPFFPYGGKIVLAADSLNLFSFVKERRKQKRELREAAAADLEVGHGHRNCEVPYVYNKHGEVRLRLSGYHVVSRELEIDASWNGWWVAWRGMNGTPAATSHKCPPWRGVPSQITWPGHHKTGSLPETNSLRLKIGAPGSLEIPIGRHHFQGLCYC